MRRMLLLALVSGAVLALIIILLGLVYNLLSRVTGGLVVEMNAVSQPVKPGLTSESSEEDESPAP